MVQLAPAHQAHPSKRKDTTKERIKTTMTMKKPMNKKRTQTTHKQKMTKMTLITENTVLQAEDDKNHMESVLSVLHVKKSCGISLLLCTFQEYIICAEWILCFLVFSCSKSEKEKVRKRKSEKAKK